MELATTLSMMTMGMCCCDNADYDNDNPRNDGDRWGVGGDEEGNY